MNKFVFIIPKTPSDLLSPLRKALWDVCYLSLQSQQYDNWQALVIGEDEKVDGNIHFLKSEARTKKSKINVAMDFINDSDIKPKYLIRLDDDDLISPKILSKISNLDYDCFADRYHAAYNILTGKINFFNHYFMPNTIIQRYEHAYSTNTTSNQPLINCDHNIDFHLYYKNKNVWYSKKKNPLYLRIVSPTCHSINIIDHNTNIVTNKINFNNFIDSFGTWHHVRLYEYEKYVSLLIEIANKLFEIKLNKDRNSEFFVKEFIKYNYEKYRKRRFIKKLENAAKNIL